MPEPYSRSIGLATWDRAELADRLMVRADDALYGAKRDGAVPEALASHDLTVGRSRAAVDVTSSGR
jgi:GGDEF domain-containing protein